MPLMTSMLALLMLGGILGLMSQWLQKRIPERRVAEFDATDIDKMLPQTQCGQCGYPGCRPYADAIAGGAPANLCIPGGEPLALKLSEQLGRAYQRVNAPHGNGPAPRLVAFIREAECIGCTKCIQACPVDAIVGAAKLMHTVIVDQCTGCDLCVEPCPVDCIDMIPAPPLQPVRWATQTGESA